MSPSSLAHGDIDLAGLTMPAGACDCHTHIFGAPSRYPYTAERRYTPGRASMDAMSGLHHRLGIERAVVVQPSPYGSDNRCTLDAVRGRNVNGADLARAVVVIDEKESPVSLLDMHAAGARGTRINLETHGIHDASTARRILKNTAERVAAYGWHIQIYASLEVIVRMADVVDRLPVPVVLDHFAGLRIESDSYRANWAALLDLAAGGNVYIKLSAPHRASSTDAHADLAPLVKALVQRRGDRLVWGTDWPHPGSWPGVPRDPRQIEPFHPIDDESALRHLALWVGDQDAFDAILAGNAAQLYGWPDRS
ncbi:MAG: amidohydrolase family protein [Pusillimonas sp.]